MKPVSPVGLLFGLLLLMASCTPAEKKEASDSEVVALSPRDFKSTLASKPDAVLVDVRTPDEFSEGIIEGAINIDFKDPSFVKKLMLLTRANHIFFTVFPANAAATQQNKWTQSVLRPFIRSRVVIKIGRMRDWK